MRIALTGATGMIGAGVLAECLADPRVESVTAIGRTAVGQDHPKLRDHRHTNFLEWPDAATAFAGVDACLFCLGVSAVGMSEEDYHRVTHDFTVATARALAQVRPGAVFCYVSGQGTDSSESGRQMWARVKGKTENTLLAMDDLKTCMFRPGFVQPGEGVRSKTPLYRIVYAIMGPLYPVLKRIIPNQLTTTADVGRAMVGVAARGCDKRILEVRDINAA